MFRRRMRKLTSPVSDTVQRLRRRFRPTIEILEERTLLSNYAVTALTDTDTGSGNQGDLRYCIDHANFNPGANTITFDPTVFATHQTITLGSNALVLVNSTGLQTITGPAAGVTKESTATLAPITRCSFKRIGTPRSLDRDWQRPALR